MSKNLKRISELVELHNKNATDEYWKDKKEKNVYYKYKMFYYNNENKIEIEIDKHTGAFYHPIDKIIRITTKMTLPPTIEDINIFLTVEQWVELYDCILMQEKITEAKEILKEDEKEDNEDEDEDE